MSPRSHRRPNPTVTDRDIAHTNSHLNALFPSNKSWMSNASANNNSVVSNSQRAEPPPVIIESDVRPNTGTIRRGRGRPKCPQPVPEQPPAPPPPSVTLPSPALTNEPSPANSNRHVTPHIDPPAGETVSTEQNEDSRMAAAHTTGPTPTGAEQVSVANHGNQTETPTSQSPSFGLRPAVVASQSTLHELKRAQESSSRAETIDAEPRQKRARVDLTEFHIIENPSYIRMMEKNSERLQEHIERTGGWQSLTDIDKGRYRYLDEACTKRDGFYLVIHQLFCAWTEHADTVHQLLAPVRPDQVDRAFGILPQILQPNEHLGANHRRHFANWPRNIGELDSQMTVSAFYQRHTPQVRNFIGHFADKWRTILAIVERRGFPILANELIHAFECWSDVMRTALFTFSRRLLGVRDQHAAQVNDLWAQDQQIEFDALKGAMASDCLDRHRPSFRAKYQAATADGRRKASLCGTSYTPSRLTPSSTLSPTALAPCLDVASGASTGQPIDPERTLDTPQQADRQWGTDLTGTVNVDKAALTMSTSRQQPIVTVALAEQQPSTTGAQQPTVTLGRQPHAPPDKIQQLLANLEHQRGGLAATSSGQQQTVVPQSSATPPSSAQSTARFRPTSAVQQLVNNECPSSQSQALLQASEPREVSATQPTLAGQSASSPQAIPTPLLPNHIIHRPDSLPSQRPQPRSTQPGTTGDLLATGRASLYQSHLQPRGSPSQASPPLSAAQFPGYQGPPSHHDFVSQASHNMATPQTPYSQQQFQQFSQGPQASSDMATAQASRHQAQVRQPPTGVPDSTMQHLNYHQQDFQRAERPSGMNSQLQQGAGQGYLMSHFAYNPQIQGGQLLRGGPQTMSEQQGQGPYQHVPGTQVPLQQSTPAPQYWSATHLQVSSTNFSSPQTILPTQSQASVSMRSTQTNSHRQPGSTPGRGRTQPRPRVQTPTTISAYSGLLPPSSNLPAVQANDEPSSQHDWVSTHMAAHLPQLRSPLRRPVNGTVGRYYQHMTGFQVRPQRVSPGYGIRTLAFELTPADLERFPKRMIDGVGSQIQPYYDGACRIRLRCCQESEEATLAETRWVTYSTRWPSETYLRFNNAHLNVPRKHHFKHDLPVELTDMLVVGRNELHIVVPGSNVLKKGTYFFAIEEIRVASHETLMKDLVSDSKHTIPVDRMKSEIAKRLSAGSDDDIQMQSTGGLNISLADPWTSVMFNIPVRGVNCRHLECLDFWTLLQTRPCKPTTDGSNREPTMADGWKCPICDEDIRPSSLRIDKFMLDVRRQLINVGKGSTKAIIAEADGSWAAVDEPEDEEDDLPPAKDGQRPLSSTNKAPHEIIEIDDDHD